MITGVDVETLRSLIAHNQSWADWSTIVVVVGLLGDLAVIFLYTKDKSLSETILSVICTAIIILGVYGEYRFGSKAAQENSQLQTDAQGRLKDAVDRLAKAEEKLQTAISEAGEANERASNNEKKSARLQKESEDERSSRVKLEALIQPRDLQYPWALSYACRPFPGHAVQVVSYAMDPEAWWLAQKIIKALWNGGIIPLDRSSSIMVVGSFETGVSVVGPNNEHQLIDAIRGALGAVSVSPHKPPIGNTQSGLSMVGGVAPSSELVTILAGVKPLPEIPKEEPKAGQQQKASNRQQKKK
jgi:hypothetical protein